MMPLLSSGSPSVIDVAYDNDNNACQENQSHDAAKD